MQNPFQHMNSGNMDGMNDPLGFVKKLWGDMQLPGMVTPTLSVDELDKQIKDLKTVESWLTVNMNLLKGTIQALEVQRATIAALKTMGESFAQAAGATREPQNSSTADPASFSSRWPMPDAAKGAAVPPKQTVAEPVVEDEMEEEASDIEMPIDASSPAGVEKDSVEKNSAATQTEAGGFSNPAGWWTVLQDQFKQALSQAMIDEVPASSKPASGRAPAATTTKPKSKKVASTRPKSGAAPSAAKKKSSPVSRTTKVSLKAGAAAKPKARTPKAANSKVK
jgi:hypothetical protein